MDSVLPAPPRRPARLHQWVPDAKGCHNSDSRRQWLGILGHTIYAVLGHIEGGNEPPLEYLTSSLTRQSGSSWLPRRMVGSSSSSSSRSSGTMPPLATVKAEP
ncbi:Protein kinase APK1A, chloroplastic [Hordeum vulgare]|nr:Protein kinase APK1A, chloroplastic [Hordeum vulgare]